MKRIGIFGGTFHPIHKGHLQIARAAMEEYDLAEVWFLPAGNPPHKDVVGSVDARIRLEMTRLAIEGIEGFKICDIDAVKETPCYTWETLEQLKEMYGDSYSFYFIIGEDSLRLFLHWVHPERICACADLLVARRPMEPRLSDAEFEELLQKNHRMFAANFLPISTPLYDISSSKIREAIGNGQIDRIIQDLPEPVASYVIAHDLYVRDYAAEELYDVQKRVKKELRVERYEHTLGVMYMAGSLAIAHDYPMGRAMMAGLLHDCAKCLSDEERLEICEKHHIEVRPIERRHPQLLHGKVGAYLAKEKYHIEDAAIAHAITYHTTGCPKMTLLDKILYIADYIEPHRDKAPRLSQIRKAAFEDLNQALFYILEDTITYLNDHPEDMDEVTKETYEYYKVQR